MSYTIARASHAVGLPPPGARAAVSASRIRAGGIRPVSSYRAA
ncbi:MAG TPA: hypothetical protein VKV38_17990 [Trebonia sp.]|nr:hypothetical protein [Trebonia sp.]